MRRPAGIRVLAASVLAIAATIAAPAIAQARFGFITGWTGFSADGPIALTTDPAGDVYVSDYASVPTDRIIKFTPRGERISTLHSDGPEGLATDDAGNLYATDHVNDRIRKFDPAGNLVAEWGGETVPAAAELRQPYDVATAPGGFVYVLDYFSDRLVKFTDGGAFVAEFDLEASGAGEVSANGIGTDRDGNVYVTDGADRVLKFSPEGMLLTQWGETGTAPGQFRSPFGVATDRAGDVYVADCENSRFQKFTPDGRFLGTWGRYGVGDGKFNCPMEIATDANGNVYVLNWNGGVESNERIEQGIQRFGELPDGAGKLPVKRIPVSAGKGKLTIECPLATACGGTVEIKRKGDALVKKTRYSVPAGGEKKVKLKLTKAGAKAVRNRRSVSGTGTLTADSGEQAKFKAVLERK